MKGRITNRLQESASPHHKLTNKCLTATGHLLLAEFSSFHGKVLQFVKNNMAFANDGSKRVHKNHQFG